MIHLSNWVEILSDTFKSGRSKEEIKWIIKEKCLVTPHKVYGVYLVDDEKVWKYLIASDPVCMESAKKMRIHNAMGVESWYEEMRYRAMRSTFPRNKHKKGG